MDYCSFSWEGSPDIHELTLVQKKAARLILDITDTRYPSENLFRILKWMRMEDQLHFRTVIMVFRSLSS